jgi:6-pyruvoyltetrahydropterin/6-carboxytetrahydropterin synthase
VTKDNLVFSAAHFITYDGKQCERLHGHNYRLTAEVCGPLDENHYVIDFLLLRERLRALASELDHYVLLPMQHPLIRVTANTHEVDVTFEDRRWVFPRGDCVLLPIPNTTSEMLARYLALRLLEELEQATGVQPQRLRLEVDDCFGQSAVIELGI